MFRVALVSSIALALALRPANAQQPPHDSVVGAVQSVSLSSRTVEITTGVGMALRSIHLVVPVAVPVKSGAASIALEQLRAGDIVRATFGGQAGTYIAYAIERLGAMEAGRAGP